MTETGIADPVGGEPTGFEASGSAPAARSVYEPELAFATELAETAGRLLIERYERIERIDYKSARDVVTEVDHLSEELIIAAIRQRYPEDAILAEESGSHAGRGNTSKPATEPLPTGRVWIIDPLDGTVNYANGIPFFCVSIGLVIDGRSVAGVVLDPTRGDLFAATADGSATLNGVPVRASTKDKLSDFVVSLALAGRSVTSRVRALRKLIRISRSMGSAALALAYVGNGRFDAFVQESGLSAWDIAAAALIAERAGAVVTAMDGGPWLDPRRGPRAAGIVAAPVGHHAGILAVVRTRG